MTKQTPGWSDGVTPSKQVSPAPAKGHPIRETPHFVPVNAPGKPKSGVGEPFKRPSNESAGAPVRNRTA